MKQITQNYRTGELKVEELPPPALRPGGLLVRTAYTLISAGTERAIIETAQSSLVGKARSRPDLVRQVIGAFKREGLRSTYEKVKARLNQIKPLGYSASGIVTAVGDGVTKFQVGDLVACAGGGYASHAEINFVPKNLCCKIPPGASLESASYTTVGAIALHGVRQGDVRLGETVAVIGLGLVGQLTVQILKAAGCRVIGIDISPAACDLAKKSGADAVASDAEAARSVCQSLTEGRGADCILVAAGTKSNEPVELAGELARDRARVVIVGLVSVDVPRNFYFGKEIELRHSRSYGPGRYDPEYEEKGNDYPIGYVRWTERRNMEAFLHLISEGKVNTKLLTTHRFNVDNATEAYDLILGKSGERYVGVVLEYPDAGVKESGSIKSHRAKSVEADELGTGFIGAGNFARGVLLPIVKRSPKVRLTGLATATGVSARNTAQEFKFNFSTTDYEQVLNDEETRSIFIATRHDSHAHLAAEGLKRGKAVFVEKPLATTEQGLKEVITAAREYGGLLMAGYNRRFAPLAAEIKGRFSERAGSMTIMYRVNAGQLPSDHWSLDATEGGGRIIGEVCHFIDFIQYMTGSSPAHVSAESIAQSRKAGYVDDSCAISLRMADGSIASILYAASGDSSVAKERVEIFCDHSIAMIDDFKSGHFIFKGKTSKLGRGSQDKGHAAEINAFMEAARGRADAPIGLDSLIATSLTTFAVMECLKSGSGLVVDINSMLV